MVPSTHLFPKSDCAEYPLSQYLDRQFLYPAEAMIFGDFTMFFGETLIMILFTAAYPVPITSPKFRKR